MFKLIPVIDLMDGQVVRGIAGQREKYRPNQSSLLTGSDPVETASALTSAFDVEILYLADLDALTGKALSSDLISRISALGVRTVVDAAVTSVRDAQRLISLGVDSVVVPLESLTSLDIVSDIIEAIGADKVVFSLDLKGGKLLGDSIADRSPLEIVNEVFQAGVRRMIVLDLAGVGASSGVPTIGLCQKIRDEYPVLELWTGGGVRTISDLEILAAAGVGGALVASALHDGRITPLEWKGCFC